MSTLVIGDIHGCSLELRKLLDAAGLASDDQIIALGDIVDRGPDSLWVLDFFRWSPRAVTFMGNHAGASNDVLSALRSLADVRGPAVPDAALAVLELPVRMTASIPARSDRISD